MRLSSAIPRIHCYVRVCCGSKTVSLATDINGQQHLNELTNLGGHPGRAPAGANPATKVIGIGLRAELQSRKSTRLRMAECENARKFATQVLPEREFWHHC